MVVIPSWWLHRSRSLMCERWHRTSDNAGCSFVPSPLVWQRHPVRRYGAASRNQYGASPNRNSTWPARCWGRCHTAHGATWCKWWDPHYNAATGASRDLPAFGHTKGWGALLWHHGFCVWWLWGNGTYGKCPGHQQWLRVRCLTTWSQKQTAVGHPTSMGGGQFRNHGETNPGWFARDGWDKSVPQLHVQSGWSGASLLMAECAVLWQGISQITGSPQLLLGYWHIPSESYHIDTEQAVNVSWLGPGCGTTGG